MSNELKIKISYLLTASFWWAATWRCVLVGFLPMIVIQLVLERGFGYSNQGSTAIVNILFIPIYIAVFQHVINNVKFSSFEIIFQIKDNEQEKI